MITLNDKNKCIHFVLFLNKIKAIVIWYILVNWTGRVKHCVDNLLYEDVLKYFIPVLETIVYNTIKLY